MRVLQKVIAVLLVLLAAGSAMVLATGPAAAPATGEAVQFGVIADAHVCNPHTLSYEKYAGTQCSGTDVRKDRNERLEDAVQAISQRKNAERIISLGDAIEDIYLWYFDGIPAPVIGWLVPPHDKDLRSSAREYWRGVSPGTCEGCGKLPHTLVLGNHDIRDAFLKENHQDWARNRFNHWIGHYFGNYGVEARVIDNVWTERFEAESVPTVPWDFFYLNSLKGYGSHYGDGGSCAKFTQDQLSWLNHELLRGPSYAVWGHHAILYFHSNPRDAIRGLKCVPKECTDNNEDTICWLDLFMEPKMKDRDYSQIAEKTLAIFFAHGHKAQKYIWDTRKDDPNYPNGYGTLIEVDGEMPGTLPYGQIMMFMVPSTGHVEGWDPVKYPDRFFEVSLDSTHHSLKILNWDKIQWHPLGDTAVTPAVFGESRYTEADPCFEQDNDGDGWFDDDKVDCPGGTYVGTELEHDQQTYKIGAELRQSCKVRDCAPGEYYAASSAETGVTAVEKLTISQRYRNCTYGTPPISELDPEPGGGGVAVVVTGPNGVARQIADANTRDYTDQTSGITVESVKQNLFLAEAHLENVPEDFQVSLYVKFRPGLIGERIPEASSCEAETDIFLDYYEGPEFAEDFALEVVVNDAQPELSSPPDGSSTRSTAPIFAWSAVTGARAYRIQVDDDEDFSSAEIDSEVSSTSFAPATPLPAGSYHWRVRAVTDCGHGAWSPAWSFKQLRTIHLPVLVREN